MKKLFVSLFLSLLIVPMAQAAVFYSYAQNRLAQNETKTIASIIIEAESEGEITAENGINLILDKTERILWNANEVTAIGSAVQNGKVAGTFTPTFSNDYKILHIPVLADFSVGESLTINGLRLRAYDRTFGYRYLGMDITGDELTDKNDVNFYTVTTDVRSDNTAPYAPRDFAQVYDEGAHKIDLTWINPPDYDLTWMTLSRVMVRAGKTTTTTLFDKYLITEYSDSDVLAGDKITYKLFGADKYNIGDVAELTVDLSSVVEGPAEEVIEEPVTEPVVPESEVDEMSRLLVYYNVRYSIKCMPSGLAVPENDSSCLWARIDLIYAQGLTGEDMVPGLALSERDMELMATRRRWPEMRYEDNCITASEPASYCPALGKALDRISYFLD